MSSHDTNNRISYQAITPKIINIKWESNNKKEFRIWASQVRAASTSYYGLNGLKLESYIDHKTHRATHRRAAARLTLHPALIGLESCTHEGMESELLPFTPHEDASVDNEASPSPSPAALHRPPGSPAASYRDGSIQVTTLQGIGREAMELNYALYTTIINIVSGPKLASIMALPDEHKTYTSVMIMLYHDDEMDHTHRKIEVFTELNSFQYEGEARAWSMGLQNIVREIFESDLTIEDVIMFSMKRMFETKVPAIRDMITQEINTEAARRHEGDHQPINFSQLIVKYEQQLLTASSMASTTSINYAPGGNKKAGECKHDLSGHPADPSAKGIICGNCKAQDHHYRRNCPFPDNGELCTICGNKGHNASQCRKKGQGEKNTSSKPNAATISSSAEDTLMASINEAFNNLGNKPKGKTSSAHYTTAEADPLKANDDAIDADELARDINRYFAPQDPPMTEMEIEMASIQDAFDNLDRYRGSQLEEASSADPQGEMQGAALESAPPNAEASKALEVTDIKAAFLTADVPESLSKGPSVFIFNQHPEIMARIDAMVLKDIADMPELSSDTSASLTDSEEERDEEDIYHFEACYSDEDSMDEVDPNPELKDGPHIEPAEPCEALCEALCEAKSENGISPTESEFVQVPDNDMTTDDMVAALTSLSHEEDADSLHHTMGDGGIPCYAASIPVPTEDRLLSTGMGHQSVVLSLCDGIGGLAASLKKAGITNVTRYIAVENDETARKIAKHAHPRTEDFCGIDHDTIHDIFDIDEAWIAAFPKGSLILVSGGGECKDFSRLRLLRRTTGKGKYRIVYKDTKPGEDDRDTDPRPGLRGPSGRTVLQIIKIWQWAIKHHPNAALLKENVVFNDMACDWQFVNANLGEPLTINSQDWSTTKRNRAYWHNCEALRSEPLAWVEEGMRPIDPDSCMDKGRTIVKYSANGRDCVRPLSASWTGDPANPVCATQKKNLVVDEKSPGEYFDIRPIEAERLMGFPEDSTDAPGVTAKDRLKALGNSWDINVTAPLIKKILTTTDRVTQMSMMVPKVLTEGDRMQYESAKLFFTSTAEVKANLLKRVTDEQLCKMTALYSRYPNGLPVMMGYAGSCVDSGAGRHVCQNTVVTNADETVRLKGFDSSTAWTSGKGYLPARVKDHNGNHIDVDVVDVENFPNAAAELLSMGKLIRAGWEFRLNAQDLQATIPGGHRVQLELNNENVLMIPHTLRQGRDSHPLTAPAVPVNFLTGDFESIYDEPSPPTESARAASEAVERYRLQGELIRQGMARSFPSGMNLHPGAIRAFQELNSEYDMKRTVDNGHY